jgi:hypothetical protein
MPCNSGIIASSQQVQPETEFIIRFLSTDTNNILDVNGNPVTNNDAVVRTWRDTTSTYSLIGNPVNGTYRNIGSFKALRSPVGQFFGGNVPINFKDKVILFSFTRLLVGFGGAAVIFGKNMNLTGGWEMYRNNTATDESNVVNSTAFMLIPTVFNFHGLSHNPIEPGSTFNLVLQFNDTNYWVCNETYPNGKSINYKDNTTFLGSDSGILTLGNSVRFTENETIDLREFSVTTSKVDLLSDLVPLYNDLKSRNPPS